MLTKVKFQLLLATAVSFTLLNSVNIQLFSSDQGTGLNISNEADARSSGRRSGGGSFSRGSSSRSSPSRSSGGSSSRNSSPSSSSSRSNRSSQRDTSPRQANPTYNRGNTGGRAGGGSFERNTPPAPERQQNRPRQQTYPRNDSYQNQPYYRDPYYRQPGGSTVIVPVPGGAPQAYPYPADPGTSNSVQTLPRSSSGYSPHATQSSNNDGIVFLIVALILAGAVLLAVFMLIKHRSAGGGAAKELDNDIVTISKIQVALLAEARSIQSQLSELSLTTDTDTSEGLLQLLQESALALLRTPENWTHVLSTSQVVRSREEAETVFNKLSFEERSKFSAETLTNVDGSIRQKEALSPSLDEDPAAYIVVTLLVGTANDQPLFEEIRTDEVLKDALHKIASISPDYLMVFELLWSPQAETDTLTYDELLTEYTDMVQI